MSKTTGTKQPGRAKAEAPANAGKARQTPRKAPDADGVKRNVRYSKDLMWAVCEHLASGQTFSAISQMPSMPSYTTLYAWQKTRPGFAEAVAASRAAGSEYCLDKALDVARNATKESVSRDRLEIGAWERRATRMVAHTRGEKAPAAEPVKVVFCIRRFEKVIGEDGRAYVREIKPEGRA